jgi:hypothetical protein
MSLTMSFPFLKQHSCRCRRVYSYWEGRLVSRIDISLPTQIKHLCSGNRMSIPYSFGNLLTFAKGSPSSGSDN